VSSIPVLLLFRAVPSTLPLNPQKDKERTYMPEKMLEVTLVVLSVVIAKTHKKAGVSGAKNYILGIWFVYVLGRLIFIGGMYHNSLGAVAIGLFVCYIGGVVVSVVSVMKSRRLLQS